MVNWLQCSSKSSCGTVAATNGSVLLAFLKGCFHGIAAMLLRLASADSSLATAEVFELFVEGLVFYSKNITVDFVFSRLSEYDTFGEASWFCEWNYNRNSWRIHLPYAFLTNLSVEFNEMNKSDLWSGLISTLLERIFSEKQIILKPSNLSRQNFSIISWSWKLRLLNKKKIYFILFLYDVLKVTWNFIYLHQCLLSKSYYKVQ